jgi:hypothetical protein
MIEKCREIEEEYVNRKKQRKNRRDKIKKLRNEIKTGNAS